jgi:hypothetical protein
MIPTGPPPSDVPEPPEKPRPIITGERPPALWAEAMEEIESLKKTVARLRKTVKDLESRVAALEASLGGH